MDLKIILAIYFLILSHISHSQGYKKYKRELKKLVHKEMLTLEPYKIPDSNYSPGTVMIITHKDEKVYETQINAFPKINLLPPTKIGDVEIGRIRKIKFSAESKTKIIPASILNVVSTSIGMDSETKFHFEIIGAEKHQATIISFEAGIENLDMNNANQRLLLKKLTTDECNIIAQALFVRGVAFTFERKTKIQDSLKVKLKALATKANMSISIVNEYKFSLRSDSSYLYYAYDTYEKNIEDIKRLYDDKVKISGLQQSLERNNDKMLRYNPMISDYEGSIQYFADLEHSLNDYKDLLKSVQFRIDPDSSRILKEEYNRKIGEIVSEMNNIKDEIDRYELNQTILSSKFQADSLKLENERIRQEIAEIERNKYDLLLEKSGTKEVH